MITFIVVLGVLYLIGAIIGLMFKLTFTMLKWIFMGILSIGGVVLFFAFAVPLLIVVPVVAIAFGFTWLLLKALF